jgi:hypothetical protein
MGAVEIIQLCIPVVTFAMGYFLTGIGYKRDRKLCIIREKFEKLYHPFYVLIHEFGMESEKGFAFDTENGPMLKPLLDHLTANAYLASTEGQAIIWETRNLFVSYMAKGDSIDKEKGQLLEKAFAALFEHLILQYMKSANALGYDSGGEGRVEIAKEI